ncbi:helicase RepA family protein [Patescibacteria group bacterium]|nr:helicase RepA family protein [Patescibacteria group bacterium]
MENKLIKYLESNNIGYKTINRDLVFQCQYCKKEDNNHKQIACFNFDLDSQTGSCNNPDCKNKGVDKKLGELFKDWNIENKEELIKQETIKELREDKSLKLLSINDIYNLETPKNLFVVDKLIPKNGIIAISGHPSSGKSWFLMFLAEAVASGFDFLGEFKVEQGSVLIIDEETYIAEHKRRLKLINVDSSLPIKISSQNCIKLDNEKDRKEIIKKIQEENTKLIAFDPFIAFHDKSENDSGDMQKIMEYLQEFNGAGATVIYLHHHRKDGLTRQRASQSIRGSSAFSGRADSHIAIEKKTETEEDGVKSEKLIISQEKLRNGKRLGQFMVELVEKDGNISMLYKGEQESSILKKDIAKKEILEMLKNMEEGMLTEDIKEALKSECDIGDRTTHEALKILITEQSITKEKDGRYNRYFIVGDDK